MFITLMVTIFAGFAGAGLVLLLRLGLGGRVPKWATPVAAGGAMIAATIASEYSWYSTTEASLPEGFEIIATHERQAWWQPWTIIHPYTDGFVAIDMPSIRTNDAVPGMRLLNIYVFARWAAPTEVPTVIDCDGNRRADLIDGVEFDANGAPIDPPWRNVDADDVMLIAACREAAAN